MVLVIVGGRPAVTDGALGTDGWSTVEAATPTVDGRLGLGFGRPAAAP